MITTRHYYDVAEDTRIPNSLKYPSPNVYRTGNYVVFDVETTTKDKGSAITPSNELVLAVWTVCFEGDFVTKYCFGNELNQQELIDDIESVDFVVAHNAKFDIQWLKRCGLDLHDIQVYCTQVAEYVIAGNRNWPLSLSACSKRRALGSKANLVDMLISEGNDPKNLPKQWLLDYCRQDVDLCHHLFKQQLAEVNDRLLSVIYTRCLSTPVLADVEFNGVQLDEDKVKKTYTEYSRKLEELDTQIDEIAGGINVNSPLQLAEFLYGSTDAGGLGFQELYRRVTFSKERIYFRNKPTKRFPDGAPKTDIHTIKRLKCKTKRQRDFVRLYEERNKISSAITKYLNFFMGVCDLYSGKFYGQYNQTVTQTGRLSASGRKLDLGDYGKKGVQFQNLPRVFKDLFTSKKGRVGEADGSQLEFRAAGHLGRDEVVKYDIEHDVDIHAFTKQTLEDAGDPEILALPKKDRRQESKKTSFRPLYGGSSGTPAVQEYCKAFRKKYSHLSAEQERWSLEVLRDGVLETEWGIKYYWPDVHMNKYGEINVATQVYNYPIQAFATAEIIPIALTFFWHLSRDTGIDIVNTVHDSIIAEFEEEQSLLFAELSALSMMDCVDHFLQAAYGIELFVPLGCGIKVGTHWSVPADWQDLPEKLSGYDVKYKGGEIALDQHRR